MGTEGYGGQWMFRKRDDIIMEMVGGVASPGNVLDGECIVRDVSNVAGGGERRKDQEG